MSRTPEAEDYEALADQVYDFVLTSWAHQLLHFPDDSDFLWLVKHLLIHFYNTYTHGISRRHG